LEDLDEDGRITLKYFVETGCAVVEEIGLVEIMIKFWRLPNTAMKFHVLQTLEIS
jgi:hypothetical protein